MKKYIFPVLAFAALSLTSCENDEKTFDDYQGGTSVYFPYQYPVRTVMLGTSINDNLDNSLDNAHKIKIYAAQGGAYKTQSINLNIAVDNTLCNNLYYESGEAVQAMPDSYYKLTSTTISAWDNYMGGVEVELTDAFFADPKSTTTTYVIPVVIKSQTGADHIIEGSYEGKEEGAAAPARTNADAWSVAPMDYTLYCVRYVNPWEAYYLVEGTGDILGAEIVQVTTKSLTECNYTVLLSDGKKINTMVDGATSVNLTLKFDGSNNCTVFDGATQIGTGSYASKAKEVAPNVPKRDVLSLSYNVNGVSVTENLVMQRRGDFAGTVVEYAPVYKQ